MKRVLWLGIGLAVGALVFRAASPRRRRRSPRAASSSRPANPLAGWRTSVRSFIDDVRDGMAEREDEIHAAFLDGVSLEEGDYRR